MSSLDVFGPVIRDASKTRGRLDRAAVRATIGLVVALKAQQVNLLVGRELDAHAADDPGFASYLRTATALMLERERRQATDGVFQQGTGGAAVGFILRRFMGGELPVSLPVPGGVTGDGFWAFVDTLTPKNAISGDDYRGRPATGIRLVHDGREYHEALVDVIDSARDFLNISAFDWKTDTGGRDIAYRLMAKKLGIDGAAYARFVARFAAGVPMDDSSHAPTAFYDIPTTRMKDLLVWQFFMTTDHPDVAAARTAALEAGATLDCAAVMSCGALDGIVLDGPDRARALRALEQLEALFSDRSPASGQARPRRALRDYIEDPDDLRRFVRRTGLRRADRPDDAFPITIVADGKQAVFNYRWGEPSQVPPFVVTEPVRDIYFMLLEFDIQLVLWKAPVEFPWNVGVVPWPGRYVARRVPMPFVPWPWLGSVPGFGWAGTTASLALQWLLASDVRMWWASVNHTKSWSSESMALESGMGMGSKYFNAFDTHKTWHDMGVVVRGPVVHDVNDHFVQVFNQARINNGGLSASRGTRIRDLRYEDYRDVRVPSPGDTEGIDDGTPTAGAGPAPARAWLLTTHPENGDANYRGVYAAALAGARHNIYIENSFFSDPLVARLLMHKAREFRARVTCDGVDVHTCAARRRDAVQIYVVLPDTSDKPIVDAVGAADFYEMLDLGIKVHRWNPRTGWSATRMLHSKVWLIDYRPGLGGLAYVGAANATQRSHVSDNEAGILSNDRQFAADVYERIFVPDLSRDSRRETGENFRVLRASNAVVAGSRWLRRLLVELLWLI
ncbi:MAG: phosphatidylserine/phosphatidylglycerophosphate/cardiolipin synthase family protein [Vicinamibacterales bacterium]